MGRSHNRACRPVSEIPLIAQGVILVDVVRTASVKLNVTARRAGVRTARIGNRWIVDIRDIRVGLRRGGVLGTVVDDEGHRVQPSRRVGVRDRHAAARIAVAKIPRVGQRVTVIIARSRTVERDGRILGSAIRPPGIRLRRRVRRIRKIERRDRIDQSPTVLFIIIGRPEICRSALQGNSYVRRGRRNATRQQQGCHATDMRRRHRGSLPEPVAPIVWVVSKRLLQDTVAVAVIVLIDGNIAPGRNHIQPGAVVRIVRACLVKSRRADRDAARVVGCWVTDLSRAIIARGTHQRHPSVTRIFASVPQRLRSATPEAQIDDIRAVVGCKLYAVRHRRGKTRTVRIEHLDRHYRAVERNSRNADPIVCTLSYRSCYVRPMSIVVVGVRVAVDKIVARDEVGLRQIRRPGIYRIVLVRHPRVDYCNHHIRGSGRDVPRILHADPALRHRTEMPLISVERVVGHHCRSHDRITLGILYIGILPVELYQLVRSLRWGNSYSIEADMRTGIQSRCTETLVESVGTRSAYTPLELHDDGVGRVLTEAR